MKSLLFTSCYFLILCSFSQSINDRFTNLLNDSETFKDYNVIKTYKLNSFWSEVSDSISMKKKEIDVLVRNNEELNTRLSTTEDQLNNAISKIESLENQITTIKTFGISIDKTVYKVINFTTIGTLIIIIGLILFRLKDKMQLANSKLKDYHNLEAKFEDFRKKSLENQMKLRRELQTERNKLEEIKSI
ncbi:MAG: hypothetical protein RLO81_13825 [Fulvivirga sp.]|uniref:hypothetical protein n=1 Tax=Fulvivirga sp. TaxID=1931237 RepID=UPI0032EF7DC4